MASSPAQQFRYGDDLQPGERIERYGRTWTVQPAYVENQGKRYHFASNPDAGWIVPRPATLYQLADEQ